MDLFLVTLSDSWDELLVMAEILHQFIGSLSHYLQGFIHPNGGDRRISEQSAGVQKELPSVTRGSLPARLLEAEGGLVHI